MTDEPEEKRESFFQRVARLRRELMRQEELVTTLDRLAADEIISPDQSTRFREQLLASSEESQYLLKHLGAHFALGVVFAFDVIPLPMGVISRVSWVIGSGLYERICGTTERARLHSVRVGFIAALPWSGYGAYLLPLRETNATLAFVMANHISYTLYDAPAAEALARAHPWIQKFGQPVLPGVPEEEQEETDEHPVSKV